MVKSDCLCLNPYSNGMLTIQKIDQTNIEKAKRLNPYSNGMLTIKKTVFLKPKHCKSKSLF